MFWLIASLWIMSAGVLIGILRYFYPTEASYRKNASAGGDGIVWVFAHPLALFFGPFGVILVVTAALVIWVLKGVEAYNE